MLRFIVLILVLSFNVQAEEVGKGGQYWKDRFEIKTQYEYDDIAYREETKIFVFYSESIGVIKHSGFLVNELISDELNRFLISPFQTEIFDYSVPNYVVVFRSRYQLGSNEVLDKDINTYELKPNDSILIKVPETYWVPENAEN